MLLATVSLWAANFTAHLAVSVVAYLLLGGLRLQGRAADTPAVDASPLTRAQWLTVAVSAGWIAGVVAFALPLGPSAFAAWAFSRGRIQQKLT